MRTIGASPRHISCLVRIFRQQACEGPLLKLIRIGDALLGRIDDARRDQLLSRDQSHSP
jgi:hypothetical protein